ncbi:MAG: carboxypeptidase-like regulatory domain-containing protein, partial [Terracidiphilus sp.]
MPLLTITVVLLAVLAGGPPASAQAVYGSIFGTVTDNSGAVLPNVTVTVTDVSKGTTVNTKTNETGLYRVQHLIPDTYNVLAEGQGFSKTVVNNVVVYADTSPEVDMQMTVGAVSNTVVVTDETPLLETDRAEVSTILDSRAVENLPNMDRNFTEFELLTPGTTYIGWGPGEGGGNPQRSGSIEVDGQLPFATGYELDGTDNQEPLNGVAVINPNLDAVSEMKVTAQNYDAEFGKAVAGLVTAQTKSGSNEIHGTAFEYRRSDAQQARDPFANAPPNNILPPTLHNQFGGSVGGPIKHDKLFFFVDYQGLREKTGTSVLTTVPTLKAEQTCTQSTGVCDLSDYLTSGLQAFKPNSLTDANASGRTMYADNQIPISDLSTAAVAFFKLLPPPNAGAPGALENNFSARGSGPFDTNQPDVRIDYKPKEALHIFGRYSYFGGSLSGAPYFGAAGGQGFGAGGFAGNDNFHYSSLASGFDYIVSPKWLTDFRFGYYRIYNNTQGPDADQPLGNTLGIPNANLTPYSEFGGLPQFNITIPANGANGGANIEYGTSASENLQQTAQYQFVNNWTHMVGAHNFKMGVDFRYGKNSSLSESGSGNVN